jgi:WD40 repeat protein
VVATTATTCAATTMELTVLQLAAPPADREVWTTAQARESFGPVRFSPDGRYVELEWYSPHLVGEGATPHTLVLDAVSGAARADVPGRPVQLSPDGLLLVAQELDPFLDPASGAGSIVHRATLWDLSQTPAARVLQAPDARAVPADDGRSVAVVPGGVPDRLAAGFSVLQGTGAQAATSIWRLDQGPGVRARELPSPKGALRAVAFRPDGRLVGVGESSIGYVWDPARRPYDVVDVETPGEVSVAVSPLDGATLAVTTNRTDLVLRRIDVARSTSEEAPVALPPLDGNERIDWMSFTGDGRFLLVNLANEDAATPANPGGMTRALVLAVDGITAGPAVVFDGEEAVSSSRDGSRIAFLSLDATLEPRRSRVTVRRTATLDEPGWTFRTSQLGEDRYPEAENVYALDETGTRVAGTNATGKLVVWSQGAPTRTCTPGSGTSAGVQLFGVAFAPDGARTRSGDIALSTSDKKLRLYDADLSDCERLVTRQLVSSAASRIRFSNDGELLLIDGIYLLDAHDFSRIGTRLHPESWNDIGLGASGRSDLGTSSTLFTADGRYVVAVRVDSSEVVRWPIGLGLMRDEACHLAGRNLTADEAGLFGLRSGNVCSDLPADGS